MKKISVIVLVALSVAFAGYAEAATPKKRTRNANRIGAYGGALVGYSNYSGDQTRRTNRASKTFSTDAGDPSRT